MFQDTDSNSKHGEKAHASTLPINSADVSTSPENGNGIVLGEYLFGVPINPFHPLPGPCPIISETRLKPIKIHVQTNKLRMIIPVLDPNLTISWLKEEFNRRAAKRGHIRKMKALYYCERLLLDSFRIADHIKSGAIVKDFIDGVKRKYKKGGHKKLSVVADILNNHLDEMMSIDDDELRQTFYLKVCSLPQIKNVDLGKDEIVSWFKRAKKKKLTGENEEVMTAIQNVGVANEGPEKPALKRPCTELDSCMELSAKLAKSSGNRFLPIRSKPTVVFAPFVTEISSQPTDDTSHSVSSSLEPLSPLAPLQPIEENYWFPSSWRQRSLSKGSSNSGSSSLNHSPCSWRDLINKNYPLSPSVLSIGDIVSPKHSETDESSQLDDSNSQTNTSHIMSHMLSQQAQTHQISSTHADQENATISI